MSDEELRELRQAWEAAPEDRTLDEVQSPGVDDAALERLARLPRLARLRAIGPLTRAGLDPLAGLATLEWVDAAHPIQRLRLRLTAAQVRHG